MKINYEFEDVEYKYEVDNKELREVLVKLLCERVKEKEKATYNEIGAYQMAMYVVYELDMLEETAMAFEDELYDLFYNRAREQYEERLENEREEQDWYGTRGNIQ